LRKRHRDKNKGKGFWKKFAIDTKAESSASKRNFWGKRRGKLSKASKEGCGRSVAKEADCTEQKAQTDGRQNHEGQEKGIKELEAKETIELENFCVEGRGRTRNKEVGNVSRVTKKLEGAMNGVK